MSITSDMLVWKDSQLCKISQSEVKKKHISEMFAQQLFGFGLFGR